VDLIHSLGANLEHVRRVLSDTGELYVDALPASYQHDYSRLIQGVDQNAAFQEASRIDPERLVVVLVGDRAQIEPALVQSGLRVDAAPASFTE
jgi:hypothetical protein